MLSLTGGTFTADANTYVQATPLQTTPDLQTLTGQAALITDGTALPLSFSYPDTVTPLLGSTLDPGVLIDVVSDAQSGGANQLLSPIDGTFITLDALGNPRVDANDRRNVGAVQLTLAPHLSVAGTVHGRGSGLESTA